MANLDKYIVWEDGDPNRGSKYSKYSPVFSSSVKAASDPINVLVGISCLDWGGKYHHFKVLYRVLYAA